MSFRVGRASACVTAVLALVALLVVASPPMRAQAATGTAELVDGDGQAVHSGEDFRLLVARGLGEFGPLVGAPLTFVVRGQTGSTFGGGVDRNTVLTDGSGQAAASVLHAGPNPGPFTVDVLLPDGHVGASFHLTVLGDVPPGPSGLVKYAGDGQQRQIGQDFQPMTVLALSGGNPVAGVVVTFTIDDPEQTGVTLSGGSTVTGLTGPDGLTSVVPGAGAAPGTFTVTAASALGDVVLTGTVTVAGILYLELVSGDNQATPVGRQFRDPLVARVTDQTGAPVGGQMVDFHVGSTLVFFEGNLSSVHVVSDANGLVTSPPLFAGGTAGHAAVIAAIGGMQGLLFDGFTIEVSR
jgi:hypothetical protein